MYNNELQLQNVIRRQLVLFAPSKGETLFRREINMGSVIPDFVCITFYTRPGQSLLPRNCSYLHAALLWILRKHARLHIEKIAEKFYSNAKRIQPLIDDLKKSKAIVRHETGAYSLSSEWRGIQFEVLAIEAKLFRWQEALGQANSYQPFSDKVVVAMDPSRVPTSEKAIQAFIDAKVGLCSVSPEGTTWIVKPRRLNADSANQEYLLTSALGKTNAQRLWSRL